MKFEFDKEKNVIVLVNTEGTDWHEGKVEFSDKDELLHMEESLSTAIDRMNDYNSEGEKNDC